jgi:Na+/pantothenate symporter
MIALQHLSPLIGLIFIVGLIAAAYSTADSALTSLTTSFCVDFLGLNKESNDNDDNSMKKRWGVHIAFSVVLFLIIIIFHWLNNDAVINGLFKAAGYTYGPILGLFSFALIFGKRSMNSWAVLISCLMAPVLTYWLDSHDLFCGFKLGFLNLLLNGLLSFIGLWIASKWIWKR